MTDYPKWSESVPTWCAAADGNKAVAQTRRRNQANIDGPRPTERRKALCLSQADVADK